MSSAITASTSTLLLAKSTVVRKADVAGRPLSRTISFGASLARRKADPGTIRDMSIRDCDLYRIDRW